MRVVRVCFPLSHMCLCFYKSTYGTKKAKNWTWTWTGREREENQIQTRVLLWQNQNTTLKNPCRRFHVDQNVDPTLKKHVADFTTAKTYSPRRSKSMKSIILFMLVIVC
jgi:hypothetical protein